MWFRNARIFHLPKGDAINLLKEKIDSVEFKPCGNLDRSSTGFVPSIPHDEDLISVINGIGLVNYMTEDKVMPASTINLILEEKIDEIFKKENRKVSRKEKAELKEQIIDNMLPRAFKKHSSVKAFINEKADFVVVDTSSASKAEALISSLRKAAPPFPCALPLTERPASDVMTAWVRDGNPPEGFEFDSNATLIEPSENGATIKIKSGDLAWDEIGQMINEKGCLVTSLGLIWDKKIRFTINADFSLKGIKYLDVLQESAKDQGEDLASLATATFTIMSAEVSSLIEELAHHFGGIVNNK